MAAPPPPRARSCARRSLLAARWTRGPQVTAPNTASKHPNSTRFTTAGGASVLPSGDLLSGGARRHAPHGPTPTPPPAHGAWRSCLWPGERGWVEHEIVKWVAMGGWVGAQVPPIWTTRWPWIRTGGSHAAARQSPFHATNAVRTPALNRGRAIECPPFFLFLYCQTVLVCPVEGSMWSPASEPGVVWHR